MSGAKAKKALKKVLNSAGSVVRLTAGERSALEDAIQLASETFANPRTLANLNRVQQKLSDVSLRASTGAKDLRAAAGELAQFAEDVLKGPEAKDALRLAQLMETHADLEGACG